MSIDLIKDDLGKVSGTDLYFAVESFTGVQAAPSDRAQEGYQLDFKEQWGDGALQTVAAFANTFGGLLLIGFSESGGRADKIVGVPVAAGKEIKTAIASAIASNVSPTPAYEIFECDLPSDPNRRICVVRVRKSNTLHLLTKKGQQPVYIRNEDESRPADAARLQSLLLSRSIQSLALPEPNFSLLDFNESYFYLTRASGGETAAQRLSNRVRSDTYLRVVLVPEEPMQIDLDLAIEEKFGGILASSYPKIWRLFQQREGIGEQRRDRDTYQFTFLEHLFDYELRWLLRNNGELHFISQVRIKVEPGGEFWSLPDVITTLESTVEAAHQLWTYLGYLGEGHLLARLLVPKLSLMIDSRGYTPLFFDSRKVLPENILQKPLRQDGALSTDGLARVRMTFASRAGSRSETIAFAINQMLRDLGYAAKLDELRKSI